MTDYDLLDQVRGLRTDAEQAMRILSGEGADMSVSAALAPQAVRLLEHACELLRSVEEHYQLSDEVAEARARGDHDGRLTDIAAMISSAVATQELGDLAFLTGAQLEGCRARLVSVIAEEDRIQTATQCEIGLRRMRRGLIAVDLAICNFEGLEPPGRRQAELEEALKVRRLYWEMRRIVLVGGEPHDAELRTRLRSFVAVVEAMRPREVFSLVRIEDRITMIGLCNRISSWLDLGDQQAVIDGRRLWHDVTAFAELLTEINNRQELREHDLEMVESAWRTLASRHADGEPAPREVTEPLVGLLGLDDSLDRLILDRTSSTAGQWKPALHRLRTVLTASGELDREVFLTPGESDG